MPNAVRRSIRRVTRGRIVKRRARRMRVPRSLALRQNNLTLKRKFFLSSWVWATATTNDFWRYTTFTASQIPNFAELANVFDQYRINGLKYTFMPRYDSVEASTATALGSPAAYAHVVIDPESTVVPSGVYGSGTLNTLMENTKVKTYRLGRPFSVYFKPKCLMQSFGGGTAGSVISPRSNRTSDTAIEHRGFHMYVHQNNFLASANGNIVLDTFVTVYLSLKNVR